MSEWKPGDRAVVTSHYTFAGQEMHGRTVKAEEVFTYPESVCPGGVLVNARPLDGYYREGEEAWGAVVPFYATDLEHLA